ASRIVLAGFSQGGAIALHTGLRHAERVAGIMALSTYLPLASTLAAEAAAANRGAPIFMAHGLYDPLIPIERATMSRRQLEAAGPDRSARARRAAAGPRARRRCRRRSTGSPSRPARPRAVGARSPTGRR